MTKLGLTLREDGTIELIQKYVKELGISPTAVINLAMRGKLPELNRE